MKTSPANLAPSVTATPDKGDLIGSPAWHAKRTRNVARRVDLDPNAAVGYARFSTAGQKEESVERQVDGIRRAVTVRRLELVQVFADRKVSGTTSDREGLSAMLDFLRTSASRPATVFVESADRLARDTRIFITLWDELRKLGVTLHDVKNGVIDNDLKAALVGAVAAQEWGGIRYRLRRGREIHAAKGHVMAGAGFGYRMVPGSRGERTVCPVESGHVRRMFEMRSNGVSVGRICKELQDTGVPLGDNDGKWYRSTVTKILSNPIYKGVYAYNRTQTSVDETGREIVRNRPPEEIILAKVDHLRIVDADLWDKVQTLWREDAGDEVHAAFPDGKYLLQGKVICHECGEPMKSSIGGKADPRPRWRCSTRAENHGCGNATSFYMEVVERQLFSALGELLERDDLAEHHFGSAAAAVAGHNDRVQMELDDVTSELAAQRAKIRRSFDDGFCAGFSPQHVADFRRGLEEEFTRLEERQATLLRGFKAALRDPSELLALRDLLPQLAAQVPFVPEDAAGYELRSALRDVIGSVTATRAATHGSLDIVIYFDLVGSGVPVRMSRTHRIEWSDRDVDERNRRAKADVEARTFAVDEERWAVLRERLPGFVAVRSREGEVIHRLLVEAVIVMAKSGATKSVVNRLMSDKWGRDLAIFGIKVQKQGGLEQLEEALRQGGLPEVGPLDLSALRYHERPNRQKRPQGSGRA